VLDDFPNSVTSILVDGQKDKLWNDAYSEAVTNISKLDTALRRTWTERVPQSRPEDMYGSWVYCPGHRSVAGMDQSKEPVAEESQSPVQKQSSSIKLPPTTVFAVDDIIAGRYKVVALLGRGGMGCVYRVQQIFLRKEYALKTLSPTDAGTKAETSWRRFQKEAQAASALDHPCLIKVHDFGTDDGQPFFVMDFFDGETLSERFKREGALTLETAIAVFSKICQGLSYAHSQGIVHRDIKPSNIMISRGTSLEVRIVDFGIAKFNDTEDIDLISLTKTGEVFGTPYFMSPEQCMGKSTDHRSDIYSLGCLIYDYDAASKRQRAILEGSQPGQVVPRVAG